MSNIPSLEQPHARFLSDPLQQGQFHILGLAGLDQDKIAAVGFKVGNENRLYVQYVIDEHFPLKTLTVHKNFEDYKSDEVIYSLFDRKARLIMVLEMDDLHMIDACWGTDSDGGVLVVEFTYTFGSIK